MPAAPPPITRQSVLTGRRISSPSSSRMDLATPILTRSLALAVALARSVLCTHETCSRMLTNSSWYGFMPASATVFLKSGSCVRGVQQATTTRFRSCSLTSSLMRLR